MPAPRELAVKQGYIDRRHLLREIGVRGSQILRAQEPAYGSGGNSSLEILDDLGAALVPSDLGRRDIPAILERMGIGQVRKRVSPGLVIVGMIGCVLVAAGTRAKCLDSKLFHHVPVVFGGGPVHRLLQCACADRCCARALRAPGG